MDHAAGNGHFEVIKWLHANTEARCTVRAMDNAAANGDLDVVKWLHANTEVGCSERAMDHAARSGRLNVLKWLRAHRSEGCTPRAFISAVCNGHLRVACWMRSNYPHLSLTQDQVEFRSQDQFDMQLFLQVNCPDIFTAEFGQEVKCDFSGDSTRPGDFLKHGSVRSTQYL
ncbi:hypothetical protein ON010_g2768 [Phytophthora cinnamomi]|nr:hypothetical protein ON010_g2768 [Phytophthora cinnamomi]